MSEHRTQGAMNLKCPPCLWPLFLNVTEALSIQYPTLAPWDQKGLEEVRFIFPTERSKDPEEKKEGYEFSSPKRCWSKGWFPRSQLHDHQGRTVSRQLRLVSCVIMALSLSSGGEHHWPQGTGTGTSILHSVGSAGQWPAEVQLLSWAARCLRGELQGAGVSLGGKDQEQTASVSRKL